jgi:hypothetical protein
LSCKRQFFHSLIFRISARAHALKRCVLPYLVFSLRVARSILFFPSNLKKVIFMKYKLAILVAFLSLVTGCSTTRNVAPYETSAQNVETLKSYKLQPVSVGTFQASENLAVKRQPGNQENPATAYRKCADDFVTVSPSFEGYIEQAFIEELKLAGIYNAASPLVLTGKLETINSFVWGHGQWSFTLTLTNARNESFTTELAFKFPTAFRGHACASIAREFAPAIQKLITDVIQNPKFREIAN